MPLFQPKKEDNAQAEAQSEKTHNSLHSRKSSVDDNQIIVPCGDRILQELEQHSKEVRCRKANQESSLLRETLLGKEVHKKCCPENWARSVSTSPLNASIYRKLIRLTEEGADVQTEKQNAKLALNSDTTDKGNSIGTSFTEMSNIHPVVGEWNDSILSSSITKQTKGPQKTQNNLQIRKEIDNRGDRNTTHQATRHKPKILHGMTSQSQLQGGWIDSTAMKDNESGESSISGVSASAPSLLSNSTEGDAQSFTSHFHSYIWPIGIILTVSLAVGIVYWNLFGQ